MGFVSKKWASSWVNIVVVVSTLLTIFVVYLTTRVPKSPNCKPNSQNIIYVSSAPTKTGCSSIQDAVDATNSTDRYTVKLLPGIHTIGSSGESFGVNIRNKKINIEGEDEKGAKDTTIVFNDSIGGFYIDGSSVSLEWFEAKTDSASPTIYISNSDTVKIGQLIAANTRGNTIQASNSSNIEITNSILNANIVGVGTDNLENISISGNRIIANKFGVAMVNTTGNVSSNLIADSQSQAIYLSGKNDLLIQGNNILQNTIGILLENMSIEGSVQILKNIIAKNRISLEGDALNDNVKISQNNIWSNSFDNLDFPEAENISEDPAIGENFCIGADLPGFEKNLMPLIPRCQT